MSLKKIILIFMILGITIPFVSAESLSVICPTNPLTPGSSFTCRIELSREYNDANLGVKFKVTAQGLDPDSPVFTDTSGNVISGNLGDEISLFKLTVIGNPFNGVTVANVHLKVPLAPLATNEVKVEILDPTSQINGDIISSVTNGKITVATSKNLCGNNVIDSGEVCDGSNINSMECADLGEPLAGSLVCSSDCKSFIKTGCDGANGKKCTINTQCQSGYCDPVTKTCGTRPVNAPKPTSSGLKLCSQTSECSTGMQCFEGTCISELNFLPDNKLKMFMSSIAAIFTKDVCMFTYTKNGITNPYFYKESDYNLYKPHLDSYLKNKKHCNYQSLGQQVNALADELLIYLRN